MHSELRDELIFSLKKIYQLKAFGALAELLQGEALILNYLSDHRKDPVYPSAMSAGLHLSRSRVTGALNSLRRKGLIELEPSREDRRMVRVWITEAGEAQIGGQMRQMLAYFDRMLDGLGAEDAHTLIRIMDRCVEIMGVRT